MWHVTLHLPWSVLVLSWKHDAPVKTIHWIKAPNYSCVMTGSWDKTLKVCYIVEGLPGLTKVVFLHYLDVSSEWLVTCFFVFVLLFFFVFQFWDTRSSNPMMVLQLPERCYCADVVRSFLLYDTLQLEDNVKTLQTLIIDVGCSLDCLSCPKPRFLYCICSRTTENWMSHFFSHLLYEHIQSQAMPAPVWCVLYKNWQ